MKKRIFTISTLLVSVASVAAQDNEEASAEIFTDEASLVVLEENEDTHVVQHLYGETEAPTDPQRIVTISDQNLLLPLLMLGEGSRVVGSGGVLSGNGEEVFRRTQDFDTSNVTYIGRFNEPDFETIAALNPDLIVTNQVRTTEKDYDTLSQIAPTVVVEQFTRSIWGGMSDFALLTNAQDEAIAQKAAYDERIAAIREQLKNPADITVFVMQSQPDGFRGIAAIFDPGASVINDLGLSVTPWQENQYEVDGNPPASLESLQLVDGDVIYVYDFDSSSAPLVPHQRDSGR